LVGATEIRPIIDLRCTSDFWEGDVERDVVREAGRETLRAMLRKTLGGRC